MLASAQAPLSTAYDLAMFDLDGVVYIGRHAVPGAEPAITRARAVGMHIAFVTNSAARPPEVVAAHLRQLGIDARDADVVTSAQAAAHLLAERFGRDSRIFLVGGDGLEQALLAEGLVPVGDTGADPVAVVTGYGPDLPWKRIMQGAVLIRDGLPWVASNTDLTIPTDFGIGPGHGVQVRMLRDFSGRDPVVAGKPERALLDETVRRVGGRRPLMVGDRLDTDIEGAHNAGHDSLLVLTGVTGLADLAAAPPRLRPTYIAPDLGGLHEVHAVPLRGADGVTLGGWQGRADGGALVLEGTGAAGDWWRVAATTAWQHLDAGGTPLRTAGLVPGSPGAGR